MLRQLPGDTEATGLGKFSHQSPRYREITSRELASADHPRFGRLRPSAIHSTPTLTQLRKQRKRKSVAVVLGAMPSLEGVPLDTRLCNAVAAYFLYIRKMILPFDLAPIYPLRHDWFW